MKDAFFIMFTYPHPEPSVAAPGIYQKSAALRSWRGRNGVGAAPTIVKTT